MSQIVACNEFSHILNEMVLIRGVMSDQLARGRRAPPARSTKSDGLGVRYFNVPAVRIVMRWNVFECGDCYFQQMTGTAMGTPAACMWAVIYYYWHENRSPT